MLSRTLLHMSTASHCSQDTCAVSDNCASCHTTHLIPGSNEVFVSRSTPSAAFASEANTSCCLRTKAMIHFYVCTCSARIKCLPIRLQCQRSQTKCLSEQGRLQHKSCNPCNSKTFQMAPAQCSHCGTPMLIVFHGQCESLEPFTRLSSLYDYQKLYMSF